MVSSCVNVITNYWIDLVGSFLAYCKNAIRAKRAETVPTAYPTELGKNKPPCALGATMKYIATTKVRNVAGSVINQ